MDGSRAEVRSSGTESVSQGKKIRVEVAETKPNKR